MSIKNKTVWDEFKNEYDLSSEQLEQFKTYYALLSRYNELFNITAISQIDAVIKYHFFDSIELGNFIDMAHISTICDVGTGGGFPGIPLKIKYPHLNTILIEVSEKKIDFLNEVIRELNLQKIHVCSLDWRTFLRKTDFKIDLFCARASLKPQELVRVFKPSCSYQNSMVVYWASKDYLVETDQEPYFYKEFLYQIGSKNRKLIFFKK